MVRKVTTSILLVLLFLLMGSVVYAAGTTTTELTIETKPNHDVSVGVTNAETGALVQRFLKNVSDTGTAKFNVISMGVKEVNIEVAVLKDGVEITRETLGPYSVTNAISISIGLEEAQEEETANETAEEEPQENISEEGVTGQAISGNEEAETTKTFPKKILLIIGIVLALGFVVFFTGRFIMTRKSNLGNISPPAQNIVVKKQSALVKEQEEQKKVKELKYKDFAEMEKKLRSLQEEFNKVKNKEKIAEIEKRIEDERNLLEKLRRGEE